MPSSSLVEVEVEVEVGVEVDVEVDATLSFRHSLDGVQILFWVDDWLEKGGLKLAPSKVVTQIHYVKCH